MTTPTAPVTVCIGTYGTDQRWRDLVRDRAMPSVARQTWLPEVHWCHDTSLHAARNGAAEHATTEWLCFLDADDELDPGYIEAMCTTISLFNLDGDWLLQPSTLGVVDGREDAHPVVIPRKPLIDGNFLVIGSFIRTEQFHRLGGFTDLPVWEDWDLFLRAWIDGAEVHTVPEAVYRVHVNPAGRNNGARDVQLRTYERIRGQHRERAAARAKVPNRRI